MGALYDRAVRDIDVPVPELSPVGPGYINLGMWMAVEDPGPYSVTASASPTTWVTVTAVLSETTFDMGNGEVVTCVGAGDPIPDNKLNSIEASRLCGYTFTARPDGNAVTITMTSSWSVSWTSSRGTGGTRAPISKSSTVEYQVLEIQTVGRSNG